jgi:serine/threonine protein kinase
MADEYDPEIVQSMLEECLNQMRLKGRDFGRDIQRLVKELSDIAQVRPKASPALAAPVSPHPEGGTPTTNAAPAGDKKVISARACVVCGRDDRAGEQRKSGFKCHECIGLPSQSKFTVEVEEFDHLSKTTNEFGEKVVNEFAFVRPLGRGSFGKVKLAVHNKSGQEYAVKILNKANLMKVHGAIEKVHQEIRIMKAMNHPNIIKIYAIIDDPDEYKMYLVMEFLEGGQIFDIDQTGMGRSPPIERERLKKHIVGIAQGLMYLHGKGIVHRDIKPENILLDKHDNVKLADFGVSSTCESGHDVMTGTEGSPAFLPPEEFRGVPVQGRAQDVWAFGVTVYTMMFGKLPFRAKNRAELERLVLTTEPEYPADADPMGVNLIKQMLEKDQNLRPPISSILEHPFVADVRCVKGFPVETITANVAVVDDVAKIASVDSKAEVCIVKRPGTTGSKGTTELLSFLQEEGPDFQLVRGGVYSVTLYSIKSDPRRKLQRKNQEELLRQSKPK